MSDSIVNWTPEEEISKQLNLKRHNVEKVIELIDNGSTLPFIARYRKECTGNMTCTVLNKINEKRKEFKNVIANVRKSIDTIAKSKMLDKNIEQALKNCKTIEDIEMITEPYKTKGPKTLADKAREAGLEFLLADIFNHKFFDIEQKLPSTTKKIYATSKSAKEGVGHLIIDKVSKDIAIIQRLEEVYCPKTTIIKTTEKKQPKENDPTKNQMKNKMTQYMNMEKPVSKLQSHQIMAIDRAEKNNFISVKINFPESMKRMFLDLIQKDYLSKTHNCFHEFVRTYALEAYTNISKKLSRKIRKELTNKSHQTSLDVFESNLRQLVMARPLYVPILGIDPGYTQGNKAAVIDDNGNLLQYSIFHFQTYPVDKFLKNKSDFFDIISKYNIHHIAIGDGSGCNEVVKFIDNFLIEYQTIFCDIKYAIVRECGASIYSVTENASKEFKGLDPKIISAVSMARRLRDPLAEFTKMDPKCIGVGMYQHDLSSNALSERTNFVLDECINLVGLDINHAPIHMLQRISGIGEQKAKEIIEYRKTKGLFKNRQELLKVRKIGQKIFSQCAGFIRIKTSIPASATYRYDPDGDAQMTESEPNLDLSDPNINPLDQTDIHPESYKIAQKVISLLGCELSDIGNAKLIRSAKDARIHPEFPQKLPQLCKEWNVGLNTLEDIFESLSKSLDFDERFKFRAHMKFNRQVNPSEIKVNQIVQGFVQNVTTFGSFIDIGTDQIGFCYDTSSNVLLGDQVSCVVTNIGEKLQLRIIQVLPVES